MSLLFKFPINSDNETTPPSAQPMRACNTITLCRTLCRHQPGRAARKDARRWRRTLSLSTAAQSFHLACKACRHEAASTGENQLRVDQDTKELRAQGTESAPRHEPTETALRHQPTGHGPQNANTLLQLPPAKAHANSKTLHGREHTPPCRYASREQRRKCAGACRGWPRPSLAAHLRHPPRRALATETPAPPRQQLERRGTRDQEAPGIKRHPVQWHARPLNPSPDDFL